MPTSVCYQPTSLQPLSNQSQSTNVFPTSAKTPTTNLITSNSSHILAPTYDDLNNIFEEDSADETQQSQPTQATKEPVSSLTTFTTQSTMPSLGATDQNNHTLLKADSLAPLQSKAATPILSVVMTPPSLDLPNHVQYFIEDLVQPMSNASTSHVSNEATKAIELNDYSSIISNKNRKNFSTLLIKNLMQDEREEVVIKMEETDNKQRCVITSFF
jgi:hypothetical protein